MIFDFIRDNQLNIMLLLCGACIVMAILLLVTKFLNKNRRRILVLMECIAFLLLWFDREAYIYAGDVSRKGYIMVRVANFMVFFLTSAIVFGFNLYLINWMKNEGKLQVIPKRLNMVLMISAVGMLLSIVSAFTGLYYHFDDTNTYHRGAGFLIAYIVPVVCPIIQYIVIIQYRKIFGKFIFISLNLYIIVPILCGILQIFYYGISIVNMSMVAVSVSLYLFTYLDINDTVQRAHEIEINNIEGERKRMQKVFDQIATAFVSAVEKKDDFTKGNSVKVAEYAKRLAEAAGKDGDFAEKVYYAALLHDVGLIGVPDSVIKDEEDPDKWDREAMRKKPAIGREILSSITEYPYLGIGAYYSHERYDGSGYPEGLSGDRIPEIARIIGVADAYVTMTTKKRYRGAKPAFVAREAFVKGTGTSFDPKYADLMIKIIDAEAREKTEEEENIEKEIKCTEFRDHVSTGIPVENEYTKITFSCVPDGGEGVYSEPCILLFDSYDNRVHVDEKAIQAYRFVEYAEIWFNGHSNVTEARKIEETEIERTGTSDNENGEYSITAVKYEDHLKFVMISPDYSKEVIVALQGRTRSAYIGLTGEHCTLKDIELKHTGEIAGPDDIRRIAKEISFIDRMESDLKNVQIDRTRSAYSEAVKIEECLRLRFHTMSLPGADLVWDCPYIVLFTSDDGRVNGSGYKEYNLIKINGENETEESSDVNRFIMKKTKEFPGWQVWKERNAEGMECEVTVERKGNAVILKTANLGIEIENILNVPASVPVYAALTGDQCALTDIRIN